MTIHLIVGPTGVGKTARAHSLASTIGAPVVALDRFQIFDELATGCGRPTPAEMGDTPHVYLTERRAADGELPAAEGYDLLAGIVDALSQDHGDIVLEGGSISLCALVFRRGLLGQYDIQVEQLTVEDERAHRRRVRARVHDMLTARSGRPSMVEELSWAWDRPQELAFVETICGYGAIASHCRSVGESPHALARRPASVALIDAVAEAHLAYAREQTLVFGHLCDEGVTRRSSGELESGTFRCLERRGELVTVSAPQSTRARAALASSGRR
jgi:adenylate dimethylallyltransferase